MKEALTLALEALEEIHVGNMTPMAEINWNKAITAIKEALANHIPDATKMVAQPKPPLECKTDAEKIAYAFGWFKALELNPARKLWVGLADEELSEFDVDPVEAKLMIAKLKEKNT